MCWRVNKTNYGTSTEKFRLFCSSTDLLEVGAGFFIGADFQRNVRNAGWKQIRSFPCRKTWFFFPLFPLKFKLKRNPESSKRSLSSSRIQCQESTGFSCSIRSSRKLWNRIQWRFGLDWGIKKTLTCSPLTPGLAVSSWLELYPAIPKEIHQLDSLSQWIRGVCAG